MDRYDGSWVGASRGRRGGGGPPFWGQIVLACLFGAGVALGLKTMTDPEAAAGFGPPGPTDWVAAAAFDQEGPAAAALAAAWREESEAAALSGPPEGGLALMVRDDGREPRLSMRLLQLPAPIAVGVHTGDLDAQARADAARRRGKQAVALVPLALDSPEGRANAVTARYGAAENARRMRWHLAQIRGYDAVSLAGPPEASAHSPLMAVVAREAVAAEAVFLNAELAGVAGVEARLAGAVAGDADVHIPTGNRYRAIAALNRALQEAQIWGDAIAVAEADAETLAALESWLAENPDALAPLTAVILGLPRNQPGDS